MFEPGFTITPKLLASIKQIALLAAELNRRPVLPPVLAELGQRAVTLSAHTSTRIEGNRIPLTEVKKLLKARPGRLKQSEREVVNYNDSLLALHRKLEQGPLDLTVRRILEIHKGVMTGLLEPYHCGRFRSEPVVVNDPRSGEVVYLAPDHKDVGPLVRDLVAFVARGRGELDPVILAGLFHKQLVLIHPFTDGNGRTSRLATTVLLAELGIRIFRLFSFEGYYDRNLTRYFSTVGETGDYYDLRRTVDFTPWLEFFAAGIVDELVRVGNDLHRAATSPATEIQVHHRSILDHIKAHGFITDRQYSKLTERAKATRALDFARLIEWGLIERHGRGRTTHYKLKE